MAEAKVKFRVRDAAAEDPVFKLNIPATQLIRSNPHVGMTRRGLTTHFDTPMTGQDPADAQQQVPKDGPASKERNTAMIKGNEATEAANQIIKLITDSTRAVDASINENVAKGKGTVQTSTVIDGNTHFQLQIAEMQLKMAQMQAESAAGGK